MLSLSVFDLADRAGARPIDARAPRPVSRPAQDVLEPSQRVERELRSN